MGVIDAADQLGQILALFLPEGVALLGVAKGDDQTHRGIQSADAADFAVVQPAQNATGKTLRGGLGGEVGGGNADVDGAVVIGPFKYYKNL